MTATAYRASLLHLLGDPDRIGAAASVRYFRDGLLVIDAATVVAAGDAEALLATLPPGTEVIDFSGKLIVPGFVDMHIHYPQTNMIAAYGAQLLDWLNTYTFPEESKFADKAHAARVAGQFLGELLRCGTTTALVFGTVHPQSVDAFFEACAARNLRMIAGKVMMDRNAPDYLRDTPESGYAESRALIEKWHGSGRLRYAVTPRFAPTSTMSQLQQAGRLLREFPDVYMHTHLAESPSEVTWVRELFPDCAGYLDVYDHAGLLGRRSVFAHCIHLDDHEWNRLAQSHSNIAFCPTSNLFLGSGLFQLKRAVSKGIRVGMGTDVGGGTSFSMLQTLNEAYKVLQMQGETLTAFKALYLATLGGAEALDLGDRIGNFETGKEADFVVLDRAATPLLERRLAACSDLHQELFALIMLGDDRCVFATYAAGQKVHQR